eukprot:12697-Heterococcus_DN1.PRE.1
MPVVAEHVLIVCRRVLACWCVLVLSGGDLSRLVPSRGALKMRSKTAIDLLDTKLASTNNTCTTAARNSSQILKLNKDADMYGSINDAVASLRKVAKLYSSERRWDGMTVFNPK